MSNSHTYKTYLFFWSFKNIFLMPSCSVTIVYGSVLVSDVLYGLDVITWWEVIVLLQCSWVEINWNLFAFLKHCDTYGVWKKNSHKWNLVIIEMYRNIIVSQEQIKVHMYNVHVQQAKIMLSTQWMRVFWICHWMRLLYSTSWSSARR